MKSTMFERYGGFGTVHRVVLSFYDKMLDSDIVGPYFDDVDMAALVDHQTKFISSVMGGPAVYTNEVLRRVHAPHAISREAFEAMRETLKASLLENGVPENDTAMVLDEIESKAPYVIAD